MTCIDVNYLRLSIQPFEQINSAMKLRVLFICLVKGEFMQSDRKGYRANGMRHPRPWPDNG